MTRLKLHVFISLSQNGAMQKQMATALDYLRLMIPSGLDSRTF
jgi:hypothetical protein